MLGCPNLPRARLTADDGGAEAAGRVGESGIGVLFTAQQGCGAAVGPLTGASISVAQSLYAQPARAALGPMAFGGTTNQNMLVQRGTAWYSHQVIGGFGPQRSACETWKLVSVTGLGQRVGTTRQRRALPVPAAVDVKGACGAADSGVPEERISVSDSAAFSGARFMESFESKHSDHDFTGRLSDAVGISAPPLRLDSQAKYGGIPPGPDPAGRCHTLLCTGSTPCTACLPLSTDMLVGNDRH